MSTKKSLQLLVKRRGQPIKNLPSETYAYSSDHAADLYLRIAAKARFDINRLRITKESDGSLIPNSSTVTIDELGLYENCTITVKDLGPQISWQTVFVIEYLGPLLIHPLVYFFRSVIYLNPSPLFPFPGPSFSQTLSLAMLVLHFFKREIETLFVHRFSSATMPFLNVFKNSFHYWVLGGIAIALSIYSPSPNCPTAHPVSGYWIAIASVLYVVGELGNLSIHMTLRGLRTAGGKERGIPDSPLFRLVPVTCPNYFFESVAWIGIWMATRSWSTGIFVVVAVGQMAVWARKKEARYRKEFGSKYRRKRFSMIPGIV